MTTTIHIPQIRKPNMAKVALVGSAILAATIGILGLQTLTEDAVETPDRGWVAVSGTNDFPDTSAVAQWAEASGLSGLSPASVGQPAISETTRTDGIGPGAEHPLIQAPVTYYSLVAPTSVDRAGEAAEAQTGGFHTRDQFLQANSGLAHAATEAVADPTDVASFGPAMSVDSLARLVGVGVVGPTTPADDNDPTDVASFGPAMSVDSLARLVGVGVVGPSTAADDYDPYPVDEADTTLARSNFASEFEWLEANGLD